MYEIRQPRTDQEIQQGLALLDRIYRARFGLCANDHPGEFFLAFDRDRSDRVVGTVSLQTSHDGAPLELERFFDTRAFDLGGVARHRIGEVKRLCCADPRVGPYLFCAAVLHAVRQELEYLVSFNQSVISRVIRERYGFAVNEHSLPVRRECIPHEYASYFLSPAKPLVVLSQALSKLVPRANEWLRRGQGKARIVFPPRPGTAPAAAA